MKIIVPFRSNPMRNTKYEKNSKNKFNKLKNTIMALFQSKIGRKIMRQRENKNYRFVSSLPDAQ